ncbi:MAG: hypothetical protein H0V61_04245 [Chitinophagales bacterium]|nr:hypothetical protein [Chitinophagales bacterium]
MAEGLFSNINRKRIAAENSFFSFLRRISLPLSRIAFFLVFFWFGFLKMMELSPALAVVHTIYDHTAWFIPWNIFILMFGAYECIIGIIFLFPGKEKYALYMLVPHAITTFGPLLVLPALTWKGFMVPNLIGQYIIKNLVIISLAIFISTYGGIGRLQKNKSVKPYAGDPLIIPQK